MTTKLLFRTESAHGLIAYSDKIPPTLDRLTRDGRAEDRRIRANETIIRHTKKARLNGWLNQSQRLWIAAEIHGLKGPAFEHFAAGIGIDRSTAYQLLKLHPYREEVVTRCEEADHWPGWEAALLACKPSSAQPADAVTLRKPLAVHELRRELEAERKANTALAERVRRLRDDRTRDSIVKGRNFVATQIRRMGDAAPPFRFSEPALCF